MTAADQTIERAADRLQRLATRARDQGGVRAKLAQPLADEAEFLRKLKPSLIRARAKGELPTDEEPGRGRTAPAGPQLPKRPKPTSGPNPFLVMGVAFAAGVALAKWIDWRGHAHPRA